MKSILIVLLCAFGVPSLSHGQVQIDWKTAKLCDTCHPSFAFSSAPHILSVIAQPLDRFDGYDRQNEFRTSDGGMSWYVFQDSLRFFASDREQEDYFFLDAARYFRRRDRAFGFSSDSGRTWANRQSYPTPFRFYMLTAEKGIGFIKDTANGAYTVDLRGTLDSGVYWYENTGTVYASQLRPYDAQFLSDSEVVVLLNPDKSDGAAAVVLTDNKGSTWKEVLNFPAGDSTYPKNVTSTRNSDALLIEAYGDSSLFVSFDRGLNWQALQNDLDLAASRTRLSAIPGRQLLLWSAQAADHFGPIENLLEPYSFPHVYPSKIMLSQDTGRTWVEQDFYPPGLDSVQIFDVIADGDRVYVVSYLDSTTYVSIATIGALGVKDIGSKGSAHIQIFPNPLSQPGLLSVDERLGATSYSILNIRGALSGFGTVTDGRLDLRTKLTPGAYTVLLFNGERQHGKAKLIVE